MNLHLHAFKGRAARVLAHLMPLSTRQSARGGLAWALATISLPGLAAPAWITGQDVRMRSGPGAEHGVITLLQKGDQVDRGNGLAVEGFCRVEKEARSGYVSCQFLSDAMVRRPRAGQDGVPADWRWVSGTQVLLRSAPSPQADVRARLAINRIVRLADSPAQGTYCEVQPLDRQGRDDGPSGFTACQMLAIEPLDQFRALSGLDASGKPGVAETERAFWLRPSWEALWQHAEALEAVQVARRTGQPTANPWPKTASLEKMKAHLAQGLTFDPPPPPPDWAAWQEKALAVKLDEIRPYLIRADRPGGREWPKGPPALLQQINQAHELARKLQSILGLQGQIFETISSDGTPMVLGLVQSLRLPAVTPSWFKTPADLASPGASIEQLAGQFKGVVLTSVRPRPPLKSGEELTPGFYDMLGRNSRLARPVQWVTVFQDGRLQASSTRVEQSQDFWHDLDEPMCDGWSPGFSFSDSDQDIWRYFGQAEGRDGQQGQGLNESALAEWKAFRERMPQGQLTAFYVQGPWTLAQAKVQRSVVPMNEARTGFVRAVHWVVDLDGDGVPDLLVWEGQGKGPGHLEGPTTTDDRWFKLTLANGAGRGEVLASDVFGYGCGC